MLRFRLTMPGEIGRPAWPPVVAPVSPQRAGDRPTWGGTSTSRSFDNSVNAVSFGFVATAILISMFLVMAIFERFLRPNSPGHSPDIDPQPDVSGKLRCPSPKMSVYANGVSVLMPGDHIPTFIAYPAPVPCPPEIVRWPQHHHQAIPITEP